MSVVYQLIDTALKVFHVAFIQNKKNLSGGFVEQKN